VASIAGSKVQASLISLVFWGSVPHPANRQYSSIGRASEYVYIRNVNVNHNKICTNCGKELNKAQIRQGNKFCSHSCSASFNNKGTVHNGVPRVTATCKFCGKEYSVEKNKLGLYCSRHCSHEGKKKESIKKWLAGEINWKVSMPNSIKEYIYDRQDNKCAICGIGRIWNNKPMNFVFDHIDGNSTNNSEDNLRAICSNCDSQLDTYKGRNKNSGRFYRMERYRNGESY
jgi:endogenous inhibitor of DNA gyrase (YacG/DUF329 family)